MKRLICQPCLVFTLLVGSTAPAAALRTVALTGQPAPGMPAGMVFTRFFESPVLNDAGQAAFNADLNATGVDYQGIWSEGAGSLNLVAANGQQALGLPDGETYNSFPNPSIVINEAGITAFKATTSLRSSRFNAGFWSIGPGNSQLIAISGQQAIGLPDGVFYLMDRDDASLVLNDAGQTAFVTYIYGSGMDDVGEALWAERNGSLELVARSGSHAPGTPDGVNFLLLFPRGRRALNNSGQVAFLAALTDSGTGSDFGLWSEGSGSLALVARTGSQAPGMPDGVVFSGRFSAGFTSPAFNNAGRMAFVGRVTGAGIDFTNDTGIWSDVAGSLALIVRSGDPAPGMPDGVKFGSLHSLLTGPALNDAGQLAFFASLAGVGVDSTNDLSLWSGAPGSLALVARRGDHAPGTEDGVVFRLSSAIPPLVLNATGQTAFVARLEGSGISDSNDQGIWATDRSGVLQLIAREGDLLEVAPGDFRTIAGAFGSLRFNTADGNGNSDHSTGNADGRPSAFNNLGQLAFYASFTDGSSGIFVSNRVAVPEPTSLLLAALAGVGLSCRSRVRETKAKRSTLAAKRYRLLAKSRTTPPSQSALPTS
jgi:hypothetical protein